MKKYIMADFRSDHLAAKARGEAKRDAAKARNEMILRIQESDDPLQEAFDLLVPSSGKADTVAGEMVRAMMKIMYRDYNDGDLFYEGYGIETCGSAVAYLCDQDVDIEDGFIDIAERRLEDNSYSQALQEISSMVMGYLYENPELFSQENNTDMYDYDGEEFAERMDWEPRDYQFSCDYPDNLQYHVDEGNITTIDIENEIAGWEYIDGIDIDAYDTGIDFYEMTKEQYAEIEPNMFVWLEQWGNDLDDEYRGEE